MQTIAATLYDEGAVIVIYAILVNCRFMLERSSNNYGKLITILVILGRLYVIVLTVRDLPFIISGIYYLPD